MEEDEIFGLLVRLAARIIARIIAERLREGIRKAREHLGSVKRA